VNLVTGEPWLGRYEVREQRNVAFWQLDPAQKNETKRRIEQAELTALGGMPLTDKRPPRSEDGWEAEAKELARNKVDEI
jgi:hypothetical protein